MDSDRNRNLLWGIILLLVALLLGLAFLGFLLVGLPPSSPAPPPGTQTALAGTPQSGSPVVPPPPTPIRSDPPLELGIPAWSDTFASSANWAEFNNDCFRSEIRDGRFWMEAKGNVSQFCWELTWPQINRFYLETLAMEEGECAEDGAYGIFLRGPDTERGYLFGLTCADQYSMYAWTGENGALILPPTPSEDLLVGEENRIGILADGDYFSIYLNGKLQTQIYDSTFSDGLRIGYFIRTPPGEETLVSFDNLTYWDLP